MKGNPLVKYVNELTIVEITQKSKVFLNLDGNQKPRTANAGIHRR